MLFYCGASIADAGHTLKQLWVNVCCLLGGCKSDLSTHPGAGGGGGGGGGGGVG